LKAAATLALGVDIGTQGAKGLLVDVAAGRVLARASQSYGLIEGLPDGHAEQHPHTWREALVAILAELVQAAAGRPLLGLGVSGQQHGLVLVDERGQVLRAAKLWCDTSTHQEARELSQRLGRHIPTGFTAPKVLWMQRQQPEIWARTRWVLLPHDWINFELTGRVTMEAGDASGTGWFDPELRCFDAASLAAIGGDLGARLPELIGPADLAGRVSRSAAQRYGLPEGLPVSAGAGDNMAGAIGSGVLRAGQAALSLGTSGTLFAYAESPLRDPAGLVADFCGSAGGHLPLVCVMNLTGVSEEVRLASGLGHGELTRRASAVEPGCGGLLWLPYLRGERVPDLPEARGILLGINPGALEPGRLYRAALEGTSLNLALGAAHMRRLGVRLERLMLVGGAAQNPLWCRILSNCLGLRVEPLEESESAALGVALQAAWAAQRAAGQNSELLDLVRPFQATRGTPSEPDADWSQRYSELTQRFQAALADQFGAAVFPPG
jgi:xylulokinase